MRNALTVAMIVVGLVLMLIGYFASAPWGADAVVNSDPRFIFSPTVFVLGVIMVFASAIVYEIFPDRREK